MRKTILAGAALLCATPALAAGDGSATGFYVALHGGYQGIADPKGTFFDAPGTFGGNPDGTTPDTVRARFKAKGGGSVGGTIGYDFGPVRFDVDLTYGRNKLNGIKIRAINGAAPSGLTNQNAQDFCDYLAGDDDGGDDDTTDTANTTPTCTLRNGNTVETGGSFAKLRQIGAIASLWYDIPLDSRIEPYVGAGIGAAGYHVETADDGDGKIRFAYQVGAGVAFNLSPHVALTADYRYRHVGGTTLFADEEEGSGLKLKGISTSLVSGGLRFTF